MAEIYPCPKMTPKQWIANFWYYYKWFVMLGIVVFTLIAICTVQFFFKADPDLGILYAGAIDVAERDCKEIIAFSESKISDQNGDGKISVSFQNFVLLSEYDLLTEGQQLQAKEEFQAYSDEILSGEASVLILDEYFYGALAEQGALINLYEIFSELPGSAVDYFGLKLSKTPLYKKAGFSSLPADSIVCLKASSAISDLSEIERLERDAANRELFSSLIEE